MNHWDRVEHNAKAHGINSSIGKRTSMSYSRTLRNSSRPRVVVLSDGGNEANRLAAERKANLNDNIRVRRY